MLNPGFFRNELLAELPMATRMLFAGLWTIADRCGRLEDRPKRIKADLFPWDEVDVDAALSELHAAGFVLRYTVASDKFIQICKFEKHQKPHIREAASEIPPPNTDSTDLGTPKANLGSDEASPRRPVSKSVSVSNSEPNTGHARAFTDEAVTERAGRFIERYEALYQQHRNGARYLVKPHRDYESSVGLCRTWTDDERLDKLAAIFLTTNHDFAEKGSRTIPQFAALASWCDSKLTEWEKAHGNH